MSDLNVGNLTIDPRTNRVRMSSMSSGIDTEALTNALYEARRLPAVRIENKIEVNEAKVAAYQDMRAAMTAMQNALDGLRRPPGLTGVDRNLFEKKAAYFSSSTTTPPTNLLGVQVSNQADATSFDLRIDSLASAQKVMSASFASQTETLGISGPETLTIGLGAGDTADIQMTADMTVYDVRNAINTETNTTGVKASVLKIADGDYRLVLTGQETGLANTINLSGATETRARLDLDNPANELSAAADAEIRVDNVAIFRPSNTITDLVDGLTIDLYQAEPGTTVTVDIEQDLSSAREAVATFVDAYNGFRAFVDAQRVVSDDGEVDKIAAPLFSDTLMRSLEQQLASEVGGAIDGLPAGSLTMLADVGVTMAEGGRLELDIATLDAKLVADPDAVRKVFEFTSQSSDPDLSVFSHTNAFPASAFTVTKDAGTGEWTLDDGTNVLTLEATGGTLKAPDGSAYDGLTLFWTGTADPSGPITINATQGIADRLYNAIDRAVNDLDGSIEGAVKEVNSQNEDWRADIAKIEERAEDYRLMLVEKFARLETALSLSESMLTQIRAQTDAMTANG